MAETASILLVRCYTFLATIFAKLKLRRGAGGLSLPPGPWILPVIGNTCSLFGALPHQALHRLAQRHGPVMLLRLGSAHTLVLSSGEAAREVHGAAAYVDRPEYATDYGRQNISFAELLSPTRVPSFRSVREEEAARLARSIFSRMSAYGPVRTDVSEMAKDMMNDVFMRVSVGEMVKPMTERFIPRVLVGERYPQWAAYLEELDRSTAELNLKDLFPTSRFVRALGRRSLGAWREARGRIQSIVDAMIRYHKVEMERSEEADDAGRDDQGPRDQREGILTSLLWLQSDGRRIQSIADAMTRYHKAEIERSEEADDAGRDDQREDILTTLLRLQSDGGTGGVGVTLTNENISGLLFDIFSAGSEAAATITWAMSELMRSPSIMAMAQSEVRQVLHGKLLTEANIDGQLHYLRMVIKETFRLHPPVSLLRPMLCTEPSKIMGYDVLPGTTVFVNMWATGRDEESWTDASEFKPERFDGFEGKKVNYGGFSPYDASNNMCPGMIFGVSSIEVTLAILLYHYDWTLHEGGNPEELDMAEVYGITTHRKTPLLLKATDHWHSRGHVFVSRST